MSILPSRKTAVGDGLRAAAALLVVLLVLWPLFALGLYDPVPQFFAFWHAALVLGLVFILALREDRPFVLTGPRAAVAALWLVYVLSTFVASVPRAAVQEVIKYGLYGVVFLSVSELVRSTTRADDLAPEPASALRRLVSPPGLVLGVWGAAVILSVASLLAASGVLPFDVVRAGRLYTFLQYPNSAGSLVGAAFLTGLGLRRVWNGRGRVVDALLAAGQWALLVVFLLTASRGAWLVMPVALVVTFFLWPPGRRLAAVGDMAATGLVAVAAAPLLSGAFGRPLAGVALVLGGLGVAVAAGWVARRFAALPARRQAAVVLGVLVLVGGLGAGLLATGNLPAVLAERLTNLDLSQRSAWERLVWAKDAFEIVKDHPLLGVGGGGWGSRYYQYQSYGYFTREIHNDFMDIWVETGTVGLAAFLALIGASAYVTWRLARARRGPDPEGSALVAALGGAWVMLVVHSALDFNLALGCVGIYLWATFGTVDGLWAAEVSPEAPRSRPARRRRGADRSEVAAAVLWPRLGVTIVVAALALLSLSLYGGAAARSQAGRLFMELKLEASYAAFERATNLDPWSPQLRMDRASASEKMFNATGDYVFIQDARSQMEAAIRLDRYHPNHHALYGSFALRYGGIEVAVQALEESLRLHPFEPKRYEQVAEVHFLLGRHYLTGGQRDLARRHLEQSVAVLDRLAAQAAKVPDYVPDLLRLPALTPTVALHTGQSLSLLGRWDEAADLLRFAHETQLMRQARETEESVRVRKMEAALWLGLVEERRGNDEEARTYLAEAREALPLMGVIVDQLRPLLGQAGTP